MAFKECPKCIGTGIVWVCSNCLQHSCWRHNPTDAICEKHGTAGIEKIPCDCQEKRETKWQEKLDAIFNNEFMNAAEFAWTPGDMNMCDVQKEGYRMADSLAKMKDEIERLIKSLL